MTDRTDQHPSDRFQRLILTLTNTGMIALGCVPNPMTGRIDRNLDQAVDAIETLTVLQEKTRGNLTDKERNLLEASLAELRIAYVKGCSVSPS